MTSAPRRQPSLPTPEPMAPPPSDFESEQAVLGSILLEPGAARRAFAIVSSDDFYWEDHQTICRAMETVGSRNEPVDTVTVSAELRRTSMLKQIGGGNYITALIGTVPTAAHVVRYATIVAEKAVLRAGARFGEDLARKCRENPGDVGELFIQAQEDFRQVVLSRVKHDTELVSWASEADEFMDIATRAGQGRRPPSAVRLGIPEIDESLGPLADEQIVLLMGPTGSCKTHLALNAVCSTLEELTRRGEEGRVFVFSFESRGMYKRRALAWLSGVNNEDIRRGFDGERDPDSWSRVYDAAERCYRVWGKHIYVCERTSEQEQIEKLWRDQHRKGKVVLGVIDYWQAMRRRPGRREIEEYTAATQAFRLLSEEYKTPVLITSQVTDRQQGGIISKGSTDILDAATLIMRITPKGALVCQKHREGPQFSSTPLHVDMKTSRVYTEREWQLMESAGEARDAFGHDNG